MNRFNQVSGNNRSAAKGFTLIELLVVIAIIAILAAILFPVFARARENARRASCQSNEKNIALGFKQYIQDNGEKYPGALASAAELKAFAANTNGLEPYIKSTGIFFCPSDSDKVSGSYGYDPNDAVTVAGRNESAIDNEAGGSSTAILLHETDNRHFGGMNIAYVDGHVKWTKNGPKADGVTGFDFTLSYNSATRTLTVTPTNGTGPYSGSGSYYYAGNGFTGPKPGDAGFAPNTAGQMGGPYVNDAGLGPYGPGTGPFSTVCNTGYFIYLTVTLKDSANPAVTKVKSIGFNT